MSKRRKMVDPKAKGLSVSRQCRLLGLHRSGLYYQSVGESALNPELMRLIMDGRF